MNPVAIIGVLELLHTLVKWLDENGQPINLEELRIKTPEEILAGIVPNNPVT